MKINRHLFVLLVVILLAAIHFSCAPDRMTPQQAHHLVIREINNQWRVVHVRDSTLSVVRARRGDTISWTAQGSDVSLQYPDSTLFVEGIFHVVLADGESVTLNVSRNARRGAYRYAGFVHKDRVFARGQSPPEIIIW